MFEWCLDGYKGDPYPNEQVKDPCIDPTGLNMREYRGGCFFYAAVVARSGNRSRCAPDYTSSEHGLRPARAVLP